MHMRSCRKSRIQVIMAYLKNSNMARIKSEHKNKVSLALRFALDGIHKESTADTPKLTGQLRADIKKSVTGNRGKITWGKRYAAYQERGYTSGKVRRYTTPGTGAHFAENAVKKESGEFHKYARMAGLL